MRKLDYLRINFDDHIVEFPNRFRFVQNDDGTVSLEPDEGEIFQPGTPLNAETLSPMDIMIAKLAEHWNLHESDIVQIKIQQALEGDTKGNSGIFADTFIGDPIRIKRETTTAVLTAPRSAGTTVLNVDNTDGFRPFTEVTIYDATNHEDVLITDVTESTITVQPLQHDYVKGAVIARSNVTIADGRMDNGAWGTYSVMEVV
ncbi:hypothetical protein [Sporosarcina newyorkensis]|uniref:hypothetical protein n=1 Tax=Sporosarcina newyorkensis TaxID=759851 RepID=UPI003D056928